MPSNPGVGRETADTAAEGGSSSGYFDRVVEAYKARLAVFGALMLAMVSLTGYGYQNHRADLFFIAAIIPILLLIVDTYLKSEIACPFLYKVLLSELSTGDTESIGLLFLDFRRGKDSKYIQILTSTHGEQRRRMFQRAYVKRGIWIKLLLVGLASGVEIALGKFLQQ